MIVSAAEGFRICTAGRRELAAQLQDQEYAACLQLPRSVHLEAGIGSLW